MLTVEQARDFVGVISEGTLRLDDVTIAYEFTAEAMGVEFPGDRPKCLDRFDTGTPLVCDLSDNEAEALSIYLDDLVEAMESALPWGFYIGATDYDGACFGIWSFDDADDW